MTTALVTHADCLRHTTPDGHPERTERLAHVLHALEPLALQKVTAPEVTREALLRCHPETYVDAILAREPSSGITQIDGDTWMSPGSGRAALLGAGAAVKAVDLVLGGQVGNAFAAIRPPGHHAEKETPMGFCLFGNAAIAAKHALGAHGLHRVAVVDFDVHHGNGTQDILWDEDRALVITSQQMPLWPGTGAETETGPHDTIVNVPLPPDSDGAAMRKAYIDKVFPRLEAFAPELIIISAGFDAHRDDPLAQLNWDEEDFVWLTAELCAIAARTCGGRVVSTLEGGYDLTALAQCAKVHVQKLIEAAK